MLPGQVNLRIGEALDSRSLEPLRRLTGVLCNAAPRQITKRQRSLARCEVLLRRFPIPPHRLARVFGNTQAQDKHFAERDLSIGVTVLGERLKEAKGRGIIASIECFDAFAAYFGGFGEGFRVFVGCVAGFGGGFDVGYRNDDFMLADPEDPTFLVLR